MPEVRSIRVCVCASLQARQVQEEWLEMPSGSTVATALQASELAAQWTRQYPGEQMNVGVWAKRVTPEATLVDQDRLELYRPLRVDPKVARRERFQKQGAKAAGLFARKRPGGKAGY